MAIIPLNFGTVGGGGGGAGVITVIDTPDENGGTIREIIAVDISKDTVTESTLLKGIKAHDRYGNELTGTHECSGTPTLQSKTATPTKAMQYIEPDSGYDGLSDITINPIPDSYIIPTGVKSISSNGTHDVAAYASANVDVEPDLQSKSVTPTTSTQSVTPDSGYDGLSSVTVNPIPSSYIIPSGSKTITTNGTHDVSAFANAVVNVSGGGGSPSLQSKTATPTESEQTITADSGYDGLSDVTVEAIDSDYVGSGITRRSSTDLTASGATVTAPAGYYANAATKSVASGTAGTPTATKGTVSNHSISVTPSVTNTTGYITGGTKTGTAVTVSASELVSGTYSVTSSGTKDVTNYASASVPSGSATTPATTVSVTPSISVSSGGLITATASGTKSVTPTVSAGFVSSGTAGTITVSGSNTQQLTTKGATTYNTSTTDQTIASGTYLTGTQTIKAVTVSGLSAANVASGVTVKVGDANDDDRIASVTGTLSFVTYYTGSSAPSSSLGSDGDIYLQTS